jgi:hypothetical protein
MPEPTLIELLTPVLQRCAELDLADAAGSREILEQEFPLSGDWAGPLREHALLGLKQGWLCNREAGGARFSRVAKAGAAQGFSIDAVLLSGDGPPHRHTRGEVNCLLPLEGTPVFCGHGPGWAVFPPGSEHVPSVRNGSMLIFYMLPDGAIEWI